MAENSITGTKRRTAQLVSATGLLPIVALTLWLAVIGENHPWRSDTVFALKSWSAMALSFLGGTYWGIAAAADRTGTRRDLVLGAMPAVAGWASLLMPGAYAFATLAVAFAAFGAMDQFGAVGDTARHGVGRLRFWLTLVAVAAMIAAFASTARSIVLSADQGLAAYGIDAILPQHAGK